MASAIIICGPTATGKTSLGLKLTKKYPFEIISADSRQVYQGMDIGTGKDIPPGVLPRFFQPPQTSFKIPYYPIANTKIWGYDLVTPDQEWSIQQYFQSASYILEQIQKNQKPPLIIGGSGLYIKTLLHPPETLQKSLNPQLRKKLEPFSLSDLQKKLKSVNQAKYQNMNSSDKNNKRRLVRAIEVSLHPKPSISPKPLIDTYQCIGLKTNIKSIDQRINHRVHQRINMGFDHEVKQLMSQYKSWDYPAFSATGYQEWRQFLEGKLSRQQAIKVWIQRETQYARRQLTWFKKIPNISWFDIDSKDGHLQIVTQIENWYASYHELQKN